MSQGLRFKSYFYLNASDQADAFKKSQYMRPEKPLALYIHIPWCEKKCPYCDFNSHLARTHVDEGAYVDALLNDLAHDLDVYAEQIGQQPLSSIFIGGGTPSLFGPDSYSKLLDGVQSLIAFSDNIEITSEANPGSSEVEKFKGFKRAGVNRLSIGIQSFNQQHLKALGRIHNPKEAIAAASYAKDAGFDNVNLDIMFGLPGQSLEQSITDIKQAIELQPQHLSCYQLTIEPNTLFHHSPPITPDDELLWNMQQSIQNELFEAGYTQYEVSAYSKRRQCQHNLNYWRFGDYLGIGAGAHAKLTNIDGSLTRLWKIKHPNNYLKKDKPFIGGVDCISGAQIIFEFMMNALRLTDGFSVNLFELATKLNISNIQETVTKHQALGLINVHQGRITPTDRGRQLLDSMLQDYLVDAGVS